MPIGPTIFESHTVEPRHEVELGGPGIAVHNRETPSLARLGYDDLGRGQDLLNGIVILENQAGET